MTALSRRSSLRAALIGACLGLAAAHTPAFAHRDFVAESCPIEGRDPSAALLTHSCGVDTPDSFTIAPWKVFELLAIDGSLVGGGVVATLHCMSRSSGAVSAVAKVKSAPSGTAAKKVSVLLPAPLDFTRCAPFVRIKVDRTNAPAKALMVTLRN